MEREADLSRTVHLLFCPHSIWSEPCLPQVLSPLDNPLCTTLPGPPHWPPPPLYRFLAFLLVPSLLLFLWKPLPPFSPCLTPQVPSTPGRPARQQPHHSPTTHFHLTSGESCLLQVIGCHCNLFHSRPLKIWFLSLPPKNSPPRILQSYPNSKHWHLPFLDLTGLLWTMSLSPPLSPETRGGHPPPPRIASGPLSPGRLPAAHIERKFFSTIGAFLPCST